MNIVKMSGAGNDFVVLGPEQADALGAARTDWVRRVCRRGLSVGADGVVVVRPADGGRVHVAFYNPDGGEAFCGNGTRCAARFAHVRGWVGERFVVDTLAGAVAATVRGPVVSLELPAPEDRGALALDTPHGRLEGRHVVAGVPHFVVGVEDVATSGLERWAPDVRRHPRFGERGTNVDVIARDAEGVRVRTFERGVEAETLACGSGAVAAAFVVRLAGGPDRMRVLPASGIPLTVALPGPREAPRLAWLEGDARFVFEGTLSQEGAGGDPP